MTTIGRRRFRDDRHLRGSGMGAVLGVMLIALVVLDWFVKFPMDGPF